MNSDTGGKPRARVMFTGWNVSSSLAQRTCSPPPARPLPELYNHASTRYSDIRVVTYASGFSTPHTDARNAARPTLSLLRVVHRAHRR
jgi:hypothetical protein